MSEIKRTNIVSLQEEIKMYQRVWKNKYNKEMINTRGKKSNDKLEFEDNEFLNRVFGKMENLANVPKKLFKKTPVKPEPVDDAKQNTSSFTNADESNLTVKPDASARVRETKLSMKGPLSTLGKHCTEDEALFVAHEVLPEDCSKLKLLYRFSSKKGFESARFHEKCDGKDHTIFVCEAENGQKFGGINYLTWGKDAVGKQTDKNMIFSISKKSLHPLRMNEGNEFAGTRISTKAIGYDKALGPIMGDGDLVIGDKCHEKTSCSSDLDVYELKGDVDTETYLAGTDEFKLKSFYIYKFS